MKGRKILSLFAIIAALALVIFSPIGAFAAFDGDDVADLSTVYYGRGALASMENGEAYVYAYDKIVECVEQCGESAAISNGKYTLSGDEVKMIFDAYRRDHVEHFWLGNECLYTSASIMPTYIMSADKLALARAEFDAKVDELLSAIEVGMSEFDIELYFHDLLAGSVTYVESENAHNSYGAIVEGQAVCEGYAEALQYLLQRSGICSFIITGSSINPSSGAPVVHEWCAVKIDGSFYHVDLTWNDQGENLYHEYFNVTDERIKVDHQIEEVAYPLPVCNSTEKNYFAVKGGAFSDGEYTVAAIAKLLKDGNLSANVYINGSLTDFYTWYGQNIGEIAGLVGVSGQFRYGMNYLGNEAVISITPAHVHELVFVPAKTETCTERGNVNHYSCACGKLFADENAQVEITEDSVYYKTFEHAYLEMKIDEENKRSDGTCQERKSYWYVCTRCNASAKDDPENLDKFFYTNDYGDCIYSDELATEGGKHFFPCTVAGCNNRKSEEACSGGTATCTSRAVCSICFVEYGALTDHVFDTTVFAHKDASGHAYKCSNPFCNAIGAIQPHTPGPEATETVPQICLDCQYILTPATGHTEHTPRDTWEYDQDKHWHVCVGCEEKIFSEAEHRFENCSATCIDCNAPLREEGERHVFKEWENDSDQHWRTCLCGEKQDKEEHTDTDEDGACDTCRRILLKSAYADMEFLQGFISFLEKFGVLRLFEPLKQKLDTLIMDAGFNPSTAATLSVTAIVLGIAVILVIILAICWLWLKFKLRRRRRKNKED